MTNQFFSDSSSELSRIVNIAALSKEDKPLKIIATPQECEAIAKRLHIQNLEKLSASIQVKANPQNTIFTILMRLDASLTYICSLTLEPFKDHVQEEFSFRVGQLNQLSPTTEEEIIFDPEEEDIEETLDPLGNMDIGEIIIQYLSLFLDPYPRSQEAMQKPFEYEVSSEEEPSKKNPFSKLLVLKTKK